MSALILLGLGHVTVAWMATAPAPAPRCMLVHGTDWAEIAEPLRACAHHVLDDTYATFLALAHINAERGVVKPLVPTIDEEQRAIDSEHAFIDMLTSVASLDDALALCSLPATNFHMDMYKLSNKHDLLIFDTVLGQIDHTLSRLLLYTMCDYAAKLETHGLITACDAVRNIGANAHARLAHVH